jgi:hypothetical protein
MQRCPQLEVRQKPIELELTTDDWPDRTSGALGHGSSEAGTEGNFVKRETYNFDSCIDPGIVLPRYLIVIMMDSTLGRITFEV